MNNPRPQYLLKNQESRRLLYRQLTEADYEKWLPFCEDAPSLKYMGLPDTLKGAAEICRFWFDRAFTRYNEGLGGLNALVDRQSNAFIGQCGLLVQTVDGVEELEIGYSILPAFHKKGYAFEAAKTCRDFAFDNNFSRSLISIIHTGNLASQNTALKNGMHLDKTTLYKNIPVNIFRINKTTWLNNPNK